MSRSFVEKNNTSYPGAEFAIMGLQKTWLRHVPGEAEEVHLRSGRPASFTCGGRNFPLPFSLRAEEIEEVFLTLCAGSVYAHRETLRHGYIALPGGVRVGVAGRYVTEAGVITGVTDISGLCLRMPHRCPGLADAVLDAWERCAPQRAPRGAEETTTGAGEAITTGGQPRMTTAGAQDSARAGERARAGEPDAAGTCGTPAAPHGYHSGGVLVIGPPGAGKTTLLREVADRLSVTRRVAVVDTRGEICLPGVGRYLTALTDCPAADGMEIAVRTLSPEVIVTDEIGREEVTGVLRCLKCGVPLFASAHGESLSDLRARAGIGEILSLGAFSLAAVMERAPGGGRRIRTEVLS